MLWEFLTITHSSGAIPHWTKQYMYRFSLFLLKSPPPIPQNVISTSFLPSCYSFYKFGNSLHCGDSLRCSRSHVQQTTCLLTRNLSRQTMYRFSPYIASCMVTTVVHKQNDYLKLLRCSHNISLCSQQ